MIEDKKLITKEDVDNLTLDYAKEIFGLKCQIDDLQHIVIALRNVCKDLMDDTSGYYKQSMSDLDDMLDIEEKTT